tara:strand:- start:220 stop:393 length:174 start_codon:yes stop_codon:yes gene_type:complete
MRNSAADIKAFYKDKAAAEKKKAISEWLKGSPEIGTLNSGKFYKFVDGEQLAVVCPI